MQISGKTALVTGGTEGIGLALAKQLKARGATVIVCGRRAELIKEARNAGLEAIRADLSTKEGCAALAAQFRDRPIDVLVNNAGASAQFDVHSPVDLDVVDSIAFLNFSAPMHMIAHLLPGLKAQHGTIVNVTSGLAIAPTSANALYCATKAGLRSFTMGLRAELKPLGVHVIEALPPVVDTAMTVDVKRGKLAPEACAAQIVAAIEGDHDEANIGQVKLLRLVYSISPALVRRIMLKY